MVSGGSVKVNQRPMMGRAQRALMAGTGSQSRAQFARCIRLATQNRLRVTVDRALSDPEAWATSLVASSPGMALLKFLFTVYRQDHYHHGDCGRLGGCERLYSPALAERDRRKLGNVPCKPRTGGDADPLGYAAGLIVLVPLSDLLNRRSLIVGQTGLSFLALAIVALSNLSWLFLFALALALAAVGALAVTVQTLVAFAGTLALPQRRGAAVGKVTGGIVIGILAARAVSGSVSDVLGWRAVYAISVIVSLITALVLSRTLPGDPRQPGTASYGSILRSLPRFLVDDRVLRRRVVYAFIIFAAFSTFWTAVVFPLTEGPFRLSHTQVGLFGLIDTAGALGARGAGKLVDRGSEQTRCE